MIAALDIETECAVDGCKDSQCEHALSPHLARITVAGLWAPGLQQVFRSLPDLAAFLKDRPDLQFVFHNGKFDMKMLRFHGVPIPLEQWAHDTCLMATASYEKIPAEWLEYYERERKHLNKSRRGNSHRKAGQHSLKTLAPYFLKVPKFWEAEDHDNDEYVLKDAEYTYHLHKFFTGELARQETNRFYENCLMPWAKMFLEAEERGVQLDMALVESGSEIAEREAAAVKKKLDEMWQPAYRAYQEMEIGHINRNLAEKLAEIEGRDKSRKQRDAWQRKALESSEAAIAAAPNEVNLDSPAQLKWLLKTHLGLNITALDGRESTDAEVLERLANEGREDVALLLKYREQQKLASTYYPSYKELSHNGVLHGNFNLDIARTGRTTSSNPNLQNQPGALHRLFIARPGYKLITKDLGAIEPTLIAYYSEDQALCDVIMSGKDFHGFNTNAIFEQKWDHATIKKEKKMERDAAKELGLAVLYGAGRNRARICLTKRGYHWSEDRCSAAVDRLRNAWPGVTAFKKALDAKAEKGEPITNLFGRKRKFANAEDVYMQAFNSIIQGSGSDLLLKSIQKIIAEFRTKNIDGHFLMSVHDETIFEVPADRAQEADEIITRNMTSYDLETKWGKIPLKVEGSINDYWSK